MTKESSPAAAPKAAARKAGGGNNGHASSSGHTPGGSSSSGHASGGHGGSTSRSSGGHGGGSNAGKKSEPSGASQTSSGHASAGRASAGHGGGSSHASRGQVGGGGHGGGGGQSGGGGNTGKKSGASGAGHASGGHASSGHASSGHAGHGGGSSRASGGQGGDGGHGGGGGGHTGGGGHASKKSRSSSAGHASSGNAVGDAGGGGGHHASSGHGNRGSSGGKKSDGHGGNKSDAGEELSPKTVRSRGSSDKRRDGSAGGGRSERRDGSGGSGRREKDFERVIKLNSPSSRQGFSYPSNRVTTYKYTWWSFIPKNLLEQFRKQANFYFLVISFVMYLGERTNLYVATIKAWSTAGMLAMMMTVSAVVAAVDDIRRHRADAEVNARSATVIQPSGGSHTVRWDQVLVGSVLRIGRNEELPADVVAMSCSSDNGSCFVSTANLDGETNLKPKAVALPAEFARRPCLGSLAGKVKAEGPHSSIYTFAGALVIGGKQETMPLGPTNLLLRGSRLRNVDWVLGLVVYTGADTRVQRNARPAPLKFPNLERVINKAMWVALITQAILALVTDVAFLLTKDYYRGLWYLYPNGYTARLALPDYIAYFLSFFVLYSNLIPVSLYATMEVCNAAFALYIGRDREMCADGEYARARSTNLCHELGQVSYIFSDKTGTLTRNVMELRHFFIETSPTSGVFSSRNQKASQCRVFERGDEIPDVCVQGTRQYAFFECLAVAHTVRRTREGNLEGESPDEEALVVAAKEHGWNFLDRSSGQVTVQVQGRPAHLRYEVLAVNEFDSARKRMSVVVQNQATGKCTLFVKGADTAVFTDAPRVRRGMTDKRDEYDEVIDSFSAQGLRCLVLGRKEIEKTVLDPWLERYKAAQASAVDREKKLMELADGLECDFEVVGVTAVEDQLQEDVARTIKDLREAGIRIWVLTGDHLKTAKSIGFSTQTLDVDMRILEFTGRTNFRDLLGDVDKWSRGGRRQELALLVTGGALERLTPEVRRTSFLQVAKLCKVVIACRTSPLQKAELVALVRDNVRVPGITPRPVTLAIGDGANDVPMLYEAQVGVGIHGREGLQAASASDFAISRFHFLGRLLLVHGRWNYRRSALVTLLTFWRNAVQELLMFYYTFISGFSGTPLFESSLRITFNLICTIPMLGVGLFDRDIGEEFAKENPATYVVGREGLDLNPRRMASTILHAVAHSLILAAVAVVALPGLARNGVDDYWSLCTITYTMLVVGCNYRAGFVATTWNLPTILLHVLAAAMYVGALAAYNDMAIKMPHKFMYKVPGHVFDAPMVPACIFLGLVLQLAFDLMLRHSLRVLAAYSEQGQSVAPFAPEGGQEEEREDDQHCLTFQGFSSQRLARMQMGFGPTRTIALLLLLAAALGSMAHHFRSYGAGVEAFRIEYDRHCDSCFWLEDMPSFVHRCPVGGGPVSVTVTVPHSLPPPVVIFYTVTPFYQNFNDQLNNFRDVEGSVFNDTFEFPGLTVDRASVAWKSDRRVLENLGAAAPDDEALAVWARPGSVPVLHKRYGTLVVGDGGGEAQAQPWGLKGGENLTVTINANFPVEALGGNKALVLASAQRLSGVAFAKLLVWTAWLIVTFVFFALCGERVWWALLCTSRVSAAREPLEPYEPLEPLLPRLLRGADGESAV